MLSAERAPTRDASVRLRRFAVAWRNTSLRQIHAVGILEFDGELYHFRYLPTAADLAGFRPFIGFPRIDRIYDSTRLWPFFALRAMDKRRPDFDAYVSRLGLTTKASVLDILSRSGGELQGDITVNLIEEPTVAANGATEYSFLVRGAGHAAKQYQSADIGSRLREGDPLMLRSDAANPVNSDALFVATVDGTPIGWVPDLLTPYFRSLGDRDAHLVVLRNNGPEAAWHLRFLVRAAGNVDPSLQIFAGPSWLGAA